jgi:hypothetical protein
MSRATILPCVPNREAPRPARQPSQRRSLDHAAIAPHPHSRHPRQRQRLRRDRLAGNERHGGTSSLVKRLCPPLGPHDVFHVPRARHLDDHIGRHAVHQAHHDGIWRNVQSTTVLLRLPDHDPQWLVGGIHEDRRAYRIAIVLRRNGCWDRHTTGKVKRHSVLACYDTTCVPTPPGPEASRARINQNRACGRPPSCLNACGLRMEVEDQLLDRQERTIFIGHTARHSGVGKRRSRPTACRGCHNRNNQPPIPPSHGSTALPACASIDSIRRSHTDRVALVLGSTSM